MNFNKFLGEGEGDGDLDNLTCNDSDGSDGGAGQRSTIRAGGLCLTSRRRDAAWTGRCGWGHGRGDVAAVEADVDVDYGTCLRRGDRTHQRKVGKTRTGAEGGGGCETWYADVVQAVEDAGLRIDVLHDGAIRKRRSAGAGGCRVFGLGAGC